MKSKDKLKPEVIDKIFELYSKGYTISSIKEETGVSKESISKRLRPAYGGHLGRRNYS